MVIVFTMSLPEHTTIIENYNQIFGENKLYEVEWTFPVLPRIGENIDGEILNGMIEGVMKDKENLPLRWQITDIRWIAGLDRIFPIIHVVGKWGPV